MSKHRPVGNEEWSMSSAQNSLTQPEQRSETFRKITTLGRMTESIAKELNDSGRAHIVRTATLDRKGQNTVREDQITSGREKPTAMFTKSTHCLPA